MKLFVSSVLVILFGQSLYGQGRFQISKSSVSFFSSAPMEDIKAMSSKMKGILDADAGTFYFKVPITSFDFKSELMKQHFNENYLESEKYPDGTFKGKIEGSYDLTKDGSYPVNAVGDLMIHGVTQKRTIPSVLKVKNGIASLQSKFNVKLADHQIKIPTIVFNKIAEVVEVSMEASLEKMQADK